MKPPNLCRTLTAVWLLVLAGGVSLPARADDYDDVDRLTRAGKLDEAMARADQFLGGRPRDPQMRFLKGVVQMDAGKPNEAIATFTQLTLDVPELPEPFNNLAVIYASQGQFDKARAVLENGIKTNPSYATTHENLGDIYARMASQSYSVALQMDPRSAAVPTKLAAIRTLFATPPGGRPGTAVAAASPGAAGGLPAAASRGTPAVAAPPKTPAIATSPAATSPAAAGAPPVIVATAPVPAARPAPATSTKPAAAPAAASAAAPVPSPAAVSVASAPNVAPPVAIAAKPPVKAAATDDAEVEKAVRGWAAAWAAQDVAAYLASYGSDFTPAGGQARKAWEEERRARIVGKGTISVEVLNLAVDVSGTTATARFRQGYRADSLKVTNRKTLELVREQGQWRIRKETVGG